MKESVFIAEVCKSLQELGCWVHKPADIPVNSLTANPIASIRFIPNKPCDIIAMFGKLGFLIECKKSSRWAALSVSRMRESQIANLNEVVAKGGNGYVFYNIRIKAIAGKVKAENRCIIIDWRLYGDRLQARAKGLSVIELRQLPHVYGRKKRFALIGFLEELLNVGRTEQPQQLAG